MILLKNAVLGKSDLRIYTAETMGKFREFSSFYGRKLPSVNPIDKVEKDTDMNLGMKH